MATWMAHIRIAKSLLRYLEADPKQLIVGSIGPDCGYITDEGFLPQKPLTHWQLKPKSKEVFSEFFFQDYLKGQRGDENYDFYLGYYLHLITDIKWHEMVSRPIMENYMQTLGWDPLFLQEVRKDWYDIDRLYLRQHPQDYAYQVFQGIRSFPNIYLPFFSEDAFEKKIDFICKFYQRTPRSLERSFVYFSPEMMDDFISLALISCKEDLKSKGILLIK
ncbi:MAG: zinc dependent phospholipase C family protein [Tissierellia bacterium]|nr:zinc dependent phospholipase C family protein [Tissierellia bacterium]